jgi:hypothetical protein
MIDSIVDITCTVKASESNGRTLWIDLSTGRKFYDTGEIVKEPVLKEMEPEQKRAHRAEVKNAAKGRTAKVVPDMPMEIAPVVQQAMEEEEKKTVKPRAKKKLIHG